MSRLLRSPAVARVLASAASPPVELAAFLAALLLAPLLARAGDTAWTAQGAIAAGIALAAYIAARRQLGIGRRSWVHAGVRDVVALGAASGLGVGTLALAEAVVAATGRSWAPYSPAALVVATALAYLAVSHLKLLERMGRSLRRPGGSQPLLIAGAGAAGVMLSRQIRSQRGPFDVVGFVDDDPAKRGRSIAGLTVLGSRDDIPRLVERHGVRTVAIAMPSAPGDVVDALVGIVRTTGVQLLTVPNLHELMARGRGLPLTEVGIADLLGRGEVAADFAAIRPFFTGRRVLVTGAAGSIGSELCRQVARLDVAELALLDTDETGLAELRQQLQGTAALRLLLRSVTDEAGMDTVFADVRPQVVIHAAAYKHVDILEDNPEQAAVTNVGGTWRCIRAAERHGTERFVFISSDKAVDARGVLGASKRIGERMVRSLQSSPTSFSAVRFGNVLASRGSVIPLFERQIAAGGPITVTHPDVRRYFMSIPEAVHLVLRSSCLAQPGGVYVLDMGDDVPIVTIAERLARLRGRRVPEDIQIVFTGLRPGERLREALVGEQEVTSATGHPRVSALLADDRGVAGGWDAAIDGLLGAVPHLSVAELRRRLHLLAADAAGVAARS